MANIKIDKVSENTLTLTGELTRETVPLLLAYKSQLLKDTNGKQMICDCAQVTQIDSAGIAALLDWLRLAVRNHTQLLFQHIPPRMQSLIDISRLKEFFLQQDHSHG